MVRIKKKIMIQRITTCLLFCTLVACNSPEPRSLNFGLDQCASCRMNIEDRRYGAQAVLRTGKQVVFDSPECLFGWYLGRDEQARDNIHSMWVTDYTKPGTFIRADDAYYVQGDAWTSPMGLNVAAFSSANRRDSAIRVSAGEPLTYHSVLIQAEEYR